MAIAFQIKILKATSLEELETKLNDFLLENSDKIKQVRQTPEIYSEWMRENDVEGKFHIAKVFYETTVEKALT